MLPLDAACWSLQASAWRLAHCRFNPPTCRPDLALGKYGRQDETSQQTLIREALEYQEIYHKDMGSAPGAVIALHSGASLRLSGWQYSCCGERQTVIGAPPCGRQLATAVASRC